MNRVMSLDDVRAILRKSNPDSGLLNSIDAMVGVLALIGSAATGPGYAIGILSAIILQAGPLFKGGKVVLEKLKDLGWASDLQRLERVQSAHVLIVYTAFFDSIDDIAPGIWKTACNTAEATQDFVRSLAVATTHAKESDKVDNPAGNQPETDYVVEAVTAVPGPIYQDTSQDQLRFEYYQHLTSRFCELIKVLRIFAEPSEHQRLNKILRQASEIPRAAQQRYEAQFLDLATSFEEFHLWSAFKYDQALDGQLRELKTEFFHSHSQLDVGFKRLEGVLNNSERNKSSEILSSLHLRYKALLATPIMENEIDELKLPTQEQIFVPQSYRALRYAKGLNIEAEETWRNVPESQDLGPFLTLCLESPHTVEMPIVVLGQPGSGKSLLTKVLAGTLTERFDVIRVELRHVNPETEIYVQIADAVSRATWGKTIPWAELRIALRSNSLVIFDGFDELLQATGQTYSGYLRKIAEFQAEHARMGQTIRVVVTSRITLMSRVEIPRGSVVIHLGEFDDVRVTKWIQIWNEKNANYFADPKNRVRSFELPSNDQRVHILARQPLLLLMLALHDSQQNRLHRDATLNRTSLYHSLISEFVKRELGKDCSFIESAAPVKVRLIEEQLWRLAVAAVGMFNREELSITPKQLDGDLQDLRLHDPSIEESGRSIGQSARILGRFFFISTSASRTAAGDHTSYEFLHNTFGEFLAAYLISEAIALDCEAMAGSGDAIQAHYRVSFDRCTNLWYDALIHAPIVKRPVVLDMVCECIADFPTSRRAAIQTCLPKLLLAHLKLLLDASSPPSRFGRKPFLGHAAIYTLNLISICVAALPEPLIIDENLLEKNREGVRTWDRILALWKGWFSLETLAAVAAVFSAKRVDATLMLVRSRANVIGGGKLEQLAATANAIEDTVLAGFASFFLPQTAVEFSSGITGHIESIQKLESADLDIGAFAQFRQLRSGRTIQDRREVRKFIERPGATAYPDLWVKAVQLMANTDDPELPWIEIDKLSERASLVMPYLYTRCSPRDGRALAARDTSVYALRMAHSSGLEYEHTYKHFLSTIDVLAAEELAELAELAIILKDTQGMSSIMKRLRVAKLGLRTTRLRLALSLRSPAEVSDLLEAPDLSNVSSTIDELKAVLLVGRDPQDIEFAVPDAVSSMNVHQTRFAELLRLYKQLKPRFSNGQRLFDNLQSVRNLPVVVEVELIDLACDSKTRIPDDIRSSYVRRFPAEKVGELDLDSIPAALRTAQFLGLPDVIHRLREISKVKSDRRSDDERFDDARSHDKQLEYGETDEEQYGDDPADEDWEFEHGHEYENGAGLD